MKIFQSKYFYLTIIALAFILLNKSREQKAPVRAQPDTLTRANAANASGIIKLDSSVKTREPRFKADSLKMAKQIRELKAKYLQVLSTSPDTCKPSIQLVYDACISLDSTHKVALSRQDSTISEQSQEIGLYRLTTHNDTIRMVQLSDSLKAEKKSRKKYWRGFKHGVITGAVLVESANIGSKFIK